jgi:Zn-dependent alcohol dehydrogenase
VTPLAAKVAVLAPEAASPRLEQVELPDPGPHQVTLGVIASGVCGSQLNRMQRPRTKPCLLGHEATGVVLAAGAEVTRVSVGQRVLVTWMPSSAEGRAPDPITLRAAGEEVGTDDVFTWADHALADEQFLLALPDDIDPVPAAVVGCAVMTGAGAVLRTAGVAAGESVAVIGTGGVGLCAVAAARIIGAEPIIAVDRSAANRSLACEFGATHALDPAAVDPVEAIRELTPRPGVRGFRGAPVAGADHVLDVVAGPDTLRHALAAARPGVPGGLRGGTAVMVGTPRAAWEVDPVELLLGGKRVAASLGGSCVPDRDLPRYLDWVRRGELPLERLVTRRFALDDVAEAVEQMRQGQTTGRSVLVPAR